MQRLSSVYIAFVGLLLFMVACKEETPVEPDPVDELVVATQRVDALGLDITLRSTDSLYAGYQRFTLTATEADSETPVSNLDVVVTPMMTMPNMMHSAPVEQPILGMEPGTYDFQAVFVMPSGEMGTWALELDITRDGQTERVSIPVEAPQPAETRVNSFLAADDSSSLFIALVDPMEPIIGVNDFTVKISQRVSMMDWPAVEDLRVEIEPEMPTMGHGSPNNVDPTHAAQGRYNGKVNFTMDGYWKVNVRIYRGEEQIGATSFDITFSAQ